MIAMSGSKALTPSSNLARSTVGNGVRPFLVGNIHEVFGNEGTGEGGAQQVFLLVDGPGFDAGPYVIFNKIFLQIEDVALGRAGSKGLVMDGIQFVPLS